MDDRKQKILFSIINSYITIGEPIGSKSLADKYNLDISPATIRNEMSSLEKMGFIEKAHTSSGRLPSDKGYRLFVDYLLKNSINEVDTSTKSDAISDLLDKRYHNASDLIETATKILAEITNLTAVSVTLKNEIKTIRNIELIRLSQTQVLLLAVFDNGMILNERVYLEYEITDSELIYINDVLANALVGSDISKVNNILDSLRKTILNGYTNLVDMLLMRIKAQTLGELNREVQIEGLGNIFNFKEYDDLSRAKEFIKLFESKERVTNLFSDDYYNELDISIGYENQLKELKNNTVITSYFKIDDQVIGHIGIVGLTRLNYLDVISNIMMVSDLLNKE